MIVVTTPTGNIGTKVLRVLLNETSESLRVLVRDAAKLSPTARSRVAIVEGSMQEAATLARAFSGADAVFWCQPDMPTAADYVRAYEELAAMGRDAIRAAGVSRVVAISAAGSSPDRPAGPITALHRMESILHDAGASLTALRCGSFFENLLWQWDSIVERGSFTYAMPGQVRSPQVATRDIATVAARCLLERDATSSRVVQLLGPADLSYDDMAAELSRQLQRTINYQPMDATSYRELMFSLGYSPSAAQALIEMFAFLENGYRVEPPADRSLTPTTLAQWLMRDGPTGTS